MSRFATTFWAIAASFLLCSAARAEVTICNDYGIAIHVAFANKVNDGYAAAGWWTVPVNACQAVDFTLVGDTLYYAADSDGIKKGNETTTEHWGNKVELFVSKDKFNYTGAEKTRRGAKAVMFSFATSDSPNKPMTITLHFKDGGTSITFTPKS